MNNRKKAGQSQPRVNNRKNVGQPQPQVSNYKNAEKPQEPQKDTSTALSIRQEPLAFVVGMLVIPGIFLFAMALPPYLAIRTLIDTSAFLARATARAQGTAYFLGSFEHYYYTYNYPYNTGEITSVECEDEITFQTETGRTVSFLDDYYPGFWSGCYQDQARLAVLYNPHNPADARVAHDVDEDRLGAIIFLDVGIIIWGLIIWGVVIAIRDEWQKRRQKLWQRLASYNRWP